MKSHVLLLIGFEFFNCSMPTDADEPKKDVDKIQGRWGAATYVQDGQGESEKVDPAKSPVKWVFNGDRVTMLADVEEANAKGTFKLDPTKQPKTFEINFPPARGAKKGQTFLGIYKIDGDTLTVCYNPDSADRPNEFKSKAGSKLILIGFKQVKE